MPCGEERWLDRSVLGDFMSVLMVTIVDKEIDSTTRFEAWQDRQRIGDHKPKSCPEGVSYKPAGGGIDIDPYEDSVEALHVIALKSAQ
jgi:hypothetical protein